MFHEHGSIWSYTDQAGLLGTPTNGVTRSDGTAVMGKGLAKQAADRFDDLESILGTKLKEHGNHVHTLNPLPDRDSTGWLISFPTKDHFREDSSIELIQKSARQTKTLYETNQPDGSIVLPEVGFGLGGLSFDDVGPILEEILGDVCTIIHYGPNSTASPEP